MRESRNAETGSARIPAAPPETGRARLSSAPHHEEGSSIATWAKEEIELKDGTKVAAQIPVIVSASRSTDIPAFYFDWFMERLKDPGQRLACGCIMSKDIGEYNTCPHLCHYCYANTNTAVAMENWKRRRECPHADTIAG